MESLHGTAPIESYGASVAMEGSPLGGLRERPLMLSGTRGTDTRGTGGHGGRDTEVAGSSKVHPSL